MLSFFNTFGDSEFSHIQSLSHSSVSREVATIQAEEAESPRFLSIHFSSEIEVKPVAIYVR
jgi:hypothetical protein